MLSNSHAFVAAGGVVNDTRVDANMPNEAGCYGGHH